jgi:hypothetical protein
MFKHAEQGAPVGTAHIKQDVGGQGHSSDSGCVQHETKIEVNARKPLPALHHSRPAPGPYRHAAAACCERRDHLRPC